MIKHIKSFNQIPITKNSLIVLDIDETIMAFPSITNLWWHETYEKHFEITNDKKIARNLSIYDWREHVKITKPYLLDEIKLKKFLGKIKEKFCPLVLLTARDPTMMKITPRSQPLSPSTYGSDKTPEPIAEAQRAKILPLKEPFPSFPKALL